MRQLLHPVLVLLSLLLLLVATPSAAAGQCGLLKNPGNFISNSWQSSRGTVWSCLHVKQLHKRGNGELKGFSTGNRSAGDDGFEWLVLQLKESIALTSVTLEAATAECDLVKYVFFHTTCWRESHGINSVEVWTSTEAVNIPGDFNILGLPVAEHCKSSHISSTFRQHRSSFKLCGITPLAHPGGRVKPLTVRCLNKARTLLLRRKTRFSKAEIMKAYNETAENHLFRDAGEHIFQTQALPLIAQTFDNVMKFKTLSLTHAPLHFDVNGRQKSTVASGHQLRMHCRLSCRLKQHMHILRMCQLNGPCVSSNRTTVTLVLRAARKYNGVFRCHLTDAAGQSLTYTSANVFVVYAPDSLTISVDHSVTTCPLKELLRLTFNFTTSAANPPAQNHNCRFTLDGREVSVRQTGRVSFSDGSVTSLWVVSQTGNFYGAHVIRCRAEHNSRHLQPVQKEWRCDRYSLLVRRPHANNSWQSSAADGDTCFWSKPKHPSGSSYWYFHSGNAAAADSGFHWFVLQLQQQVSITAVTLFGRTEDVACTNQEDDLKCTAEYNRHNRVQVWTSPAALDFGDDHCTSASISSTFQQHKDSFRLCGITSSTAPPTPGLNLTVHCVARVKTLLLRRRVDFSGVASINATSLDSVMSFSDIRLNRPEVEIFVNRQNEDVIVNKGDEVQVTCRAASSVQPHTLQLCQPSGSCTNSSSTEAAVTVSSAAAQDDGTYWCKLMDAGGHSISISSADVTVACSLMVRKQHVSNSWQTSFGEGDTCFWNRTEMPSGQWKYKYFLSGDGLTAERYNFFFNSFQWFVLQLHQPIILVALTLIGRTEDATAWCSNYHGQQYCKTEFYRHNQVDVFVSPAAVNFGDDHCTSRNISATFRWHSALFRFCGRTNAATSPAPGLNLTVHCVAKVKTLLFVRKVDRPNKYFDSVMSFSGIQLNYSEVDIFVNGRKEDVTVKKGDKVQVTCRAACNVRPHTLQLCQPSGSCTNSSSTEAAVTVSSAGPQHNGTYWCKLIVVKTRDRYDETISSADVTVTYPPDSLSIYVNESLANCEEQTAPKLVFVFASSPANPPANRHTCSFQRNGRHRWVTKMSQNESASGAVTSRWMALHPFMNWGHSAISCTAVQSPRRNATVSFNTTHSVKGWWLCHTCRRLIRKSHVMQSWQSSYGAGDTCFQNRSAGALVSSTNRYSQFHSAAAAAKFEWLVLQLKRLVAITQVTLHGLDYCVSDFQSCAEQQNRHAGVQVWTSRSAVNFGDNHCTAESFGSTFRSFHLQFSPCDYDRFSEQSPGSKKVTYYCVAWVKTLLLKRWNGHGWVNSPRNVMSFGGIEVTEPYFNSSVNGKNGYVTLSKGVAVYVKCGAVCSVQPHTLQLCPPTGSCIAIQRNGVVRLGSADAAQHNGQFWCQLTDARGMSISKYVAGVTVIDPPDSLAISVNESVTTCELEEIPELLFTFTSSAASPPAVNHACNFTVDGRQVNVRKSSEVAGANGEVASEWVAQVALQNNGAFAISCDARQPPSVTGGLSSVHHVTERWKCERE